MKYTEVSARNLKALKNRIKRTSTKAEREKIVKIVPQNKVLYNKMRLYKIYYSK